MAGPGTRGRKRKEVLLQESLHGTNGGLLQMQLHAAFLPSPPPQNLAISPAKHRYPTRRSIAVPNQCLSSMVSLRYPLRNQMEIPKQCYVTAWKILLEANKYAPYSKQRDTSFRITSEIPHQDQVSTSPATSLCYSIPSARIDKSMKKARNSVSTKLEDWSASVSKAGLDMENFTEHLISQG